MLRVTVTALLAALALAACTGGESGPKKTGAAVAKGEGVLITSDEFKARLEEQSPFIRARYTTLDRKKEFLDNLVRFEVLANEARRQGLDKDPEVQLTLRKVMVQKLVQKNFQDQSGAKDVPEAELQKYFDEHKDEFYRPRKTRLSVIAWKAPAGAPERARKLAAARKVLAEVKAAEKTNTLAFAAAVQKHSEDAESKARAGDLNFKTKEELEKDFGPAFAGAAAEARSGDLLGPIEAEKGVYLVKVTGVQEEVNRPFEAVKQQIAGRVFREKKSKEFDEYVKSLREKAKVTVDEKALDAVTVAAGPTPGAQPGMPPGMPGMTSSPPPHGAGGPPPVVAPAPAPAPAPARP